MQNSPAFQEVRTAAVQVRCMAAVLLMVGRGLEQPSVVQTMLNITATPQKPLYNIAAEV